MTHTSTPCFSHSSIESWMLRALLAPPGLPRKGVGMEELVLGLRHGLVLGGSIIERMRRWLPALILVAAVAAGSPGTAAESPRVLAATLDNGLRVLLLEDHRSPIVTVQL